MKILMLIDSLDVGGAESHVEVLATELSAMGHEIIVASAGGVICKRLRRTTVRCVCLPQILKNGQKSGGISFGCSFFALQSIISRLVRHIKPDVVHAHTRRTAFLVNRVCKTQKIPLIVTAHALFVMNFPKNLFSKWGNRTIAVSEDIKNHLVAHKIPRDQICVIANGVKLPTRDNGNGIVPRNTAQPTSPPAPLPQTFAPEVKLSTPPSQADAPATSLSAPLSQPTAPATTPSAPPSQTVAPVTTPSAHLSQAVAPATTPPAPPFQTDVLATAKPFDLPAINGISQKNEVRWMDK